MFPKLRKLFVQYFVDMRWYSIVLALFFYGLSSWLLLFLAGESALLRVDDFIYWLVVTGSTVGYGDFSPSTIAGKYIVSFYVIPLGLSIFALVIGRIAAWISAQWQKGVQGLKSLNVENHILVIGWNERRTLHLLDLLLKEKQSAFDNPDLVLCVRADISNPMPGQVEFVRVHSFNKDDEMQKACVDKAKVIIMDNPEDDLTLTTALYCSQANPDAHKLAYFKDESLVKLLQTHCPEIECTPSVAVEMLAKSAFDPGSSALHHDLLTVRDGQAQFSANLPANSPNLRIESLFEGLKRNYQATLIGIASGQQQHEIELNPPLDKSISAGDKIYYIAKDRIPHLDWQAFSQ